MKIKRFKPKKQILSAIKEKCRTNNYSSPLLLVQDIAWVFIFAALANRFVFLYPVLIFFIAARQRALATILHDSIHNIATKNKTLNLMIGQLCGFLILQSRTKYKRTHLAHHFHLGAAGKDPDYDFYRELGLFSEKMTKNRFVVHYIIKPILFGRTFFFLKYLVKNRLSIALNQETYFLMLFWAAIFFCAWLLGALSFLILYWLIPLFLVFPSICYFIEIAEHFPSIAYTKDILFISRNRKHSFIGRQIFGLHQESYHLVHHLYPSIPTWNMKASHKILLADPDYEFANKDNGGMLIGGGSNSFLRSVLRSLP